MFDNLSAAKIYSDLSTDPTIKATIIEDRRWSVDDFAEKHSKTVIQHYKDELEIKAEDGYQAAVNLWRYLSEPEKNKKPIPLNVSGVAYITVTGCVRYCTTGRGLPFPNDFKVWYGEWSKNTPKT